VVEEEQETQQTHVREPEQDSAGEFNFNLTKEDSKATPYRDRSVNVIEPEPRVEI